MLRRIIFVVAVSAVTLSAQAADKYSFDPTHSQLQLGWNHFGFSNLTARFDKFDGELMLDTHDLTKSSVSVVVTIDSIDTGVAKLDEHMKSPNFFDAARFPTATFKSAKVEKVGENKLKVTGDLTIRGLTKPAVLDVTINKIGPHPMAKDDAAGFDAIATIKRSDYGIDKYVPNVSDEIRIRVTAETHKVK